MGNEWLTLVLVAVRVVGADTGAGDSHGGVWNAVLR
jgi:hypothetical protein